MKNIVFLTGAGISASSGIKTFRDSGGLWEEYNVMDVASIEGWHKNPKLVQEFYNKRRSQLKTTKANEAHKIIAQLEKSFKVNIITQNVDNLHEQAKSTNILHLHGELTKACNESKDEIIDIGYSAIEEGQLAKDGSRLRPFIVWFGEDVPLFKKAIEIVREADILVIVGTSMQVYPAASLVDFIKKDTPIYLIDPNDVEFYRENLKVIKEEAIIGMKILEDELKKV